MNAVLRQAVGEISRGVSMGLVTWAASSPCSPHLVCAACPDCVCSCRDGGRVVATADCEGCPGSSIAAAVFGFALGVAVVLGCQALRTRGATQSSKGRTSGRGAWLKLE